MTKPTFETLQTLNTEFNADSVEWCPIEPFQNVLVCGLYQCKEEGGIYNRFGKINLFIFNPETLQLELKQSITVDGILDQKWCHHPINGVPHLAAVNSAGALQIYILDQGPTLKMIAESVTNSTIAMSVDWSNNKLDNEPRLVVSDTAGFIRVYNFNSNSGIVEDCSWKAHDWDAWICAFDCWNPSVLITGGDDCKMLMFDLRCGQKAQACVKHDMGVTSLHFNDMKEFTFASGGYDSVVCLRDVRNLKHQIGDVKVGDRIWRLKWDPRNRNKLLAACTLDGVTVLDCQDMTTPTIEAVYKEHESLAYGVDWCYDDSILRNGNFLISSCSFYDNKLNIARFFEK